MFDAIARVLDFFYSLPVVGGSYGFAIILLTAAVMTLLMPLTLKATRSTIKMQEMQPKLKELQKKHKDDKQRQQQEMMKFYQENEINPLASCVPLLLQLPVFIALFYMLRGESFRCDVRANELPPCDVPGPNESFLFIDSILEKPVGSELVILIVLFVGTQLLAGLAMAVRGQGLEGPQKFIVFGLPLAFAPFVGTFLAGLSIYWISTNVWTFGQQQVVTSLMPPPPKKTPEEVEAEKAPPPPPPRKKKKRSGKRR